MRYLLLILISFKLSSVPETSFILVSGIGMMELRAISSKPGIDLTKEKREMQTEKMIRIRT